MAALSQAAAGLVQPLYALEPLVPTERTLCMRLRERAAAFSQRKGIDLQGEQFTLDCEVGEAGRLAATAERIAVKISGCVGTGARTLERMQAAEAALKSRGQHPFPCLEERLKQVAESRATDPTGTYQYAVLIGGSVTWRSSRCSWVACLCGVTP
eukprot:TRINITY_DN31331_c0_g3_i1.p1 TRINITY_DN31331_c0_g3~~TRINITY_DN31331_c0_g3_i1.p1  ORF type:complete len:155 (+),score=28.67 TRINITY_DN31331_c0_g3_i1:110-574(+)